MADGPQLEPWQTGAPVTAAAPQPPADPTLAEAGTGAYRNARYPNLVHGPDGQPIGVGDFSRQDATRDADGTLNLTISGSTSPESIQDFLKQHPDALDHPTSTAPDADTAGSGAQADGAGGGGAPDWRSGTPMQGAAQEHAANDAQAEVAQTLPDDTSKGIWKALQGATYGFGDEAAAGLDALKVGGANLVGRGPGYGMGDAYSAKMDAIHGAESGFDQAHPWLGVGLEAAGSMANPLSYVGGGWIKGAESVGSAVGRTMLTGAGLGAIGGAGHADGGIGQRLNGAVTGAGTGAIAGGAVAGLGEGLGAGATALGVRARVPMSANQATAQATLRQLGIDPATLPPPTTSALTASLAQGQHPADAIVSLLAKGLPVPVPLSRGQITGDPAQQLTENMMLRGARGQSASRTAQMFKADQQQALRGNVDQIGSDISGGFPTPRGQAGEGVSDALNNASDRAWQGVNSAYDAARSAPEPAYLAPPEALRFVQAAKQGMADFDPLNVPRVAREVGRLQESAAPWAADLPPGVNPARISSVAGAKPADIRSLFEARTRIAHLRQSNGVEAAAAESVLKHFDAAMSDSLTNDLFHGDPATVDLWRKAIGARADFGRTFEANDLVQKLTARDGMGRGAQLKVDPHDASNYIFGRSNLGFVGRQNLYRGLERLKGVLGGDSDAWNRLRGEAFTRISGNAEGPMEGGAAQFSGAKFAAGWNKAKNEDPELIDTLFHPHERAVIDQFAAIASRATKPVTGGDNASNSGITAARAFGALKRLPFLGLESIPFVDHFADKIDAGVANMAIKRATYGAKPRMAAAPAATMTSPVLAPFAAAYADMQRKKLLTGGR